ncbi:MAG: methionine--tRNA ligase [bacterium]
MGKYYVSTPIYYVNDVPHIGTAYPTVAADVIARFHRMIGDNVLFSTGTDENATKVARVASEKGIDTLQFVNQMAAAFQDTWKKMNISYDDFVRTVEPRHHTAVQNLIKILYNNGDVYYSEYEGWYCIPCETHFMEAQLNEGKCPDCGRAVEWMKEPGYFFKLSKYQQPLLDYIEANPHWLQPDFRKNEVVSFIKSGLRDVNITRKADWGIPVPANLPNSAGLVIYVWYDALINYITVAGYGQDENKFKEWWPAQSHIVGKDIFTRFHATLWPAMLMGAGIELPKTVVAHGFWTIGGEKISKSKHSGKGFRINPLDLANEIVEASGADIDIAVDALRYFLLREMPFGADGDFSLEALFRRYNSDLANDLGNLLNRVITMIGKYCNGNIPSPAPALPAAINAATSVYEHLKSEVVNYNEALKAAWELVSYLNRYIEEMTPWKLYKEGKTEEVNNVMYTLAEGLRFTAVILSPFMPITSKHIAAQIGWNTEICKWDDLKWGLLNSENNVCPDKPIFPRIIEKKETEMTEEIVKIPVPIQTAEPAKAVEAEEEKVPETPLITIDDFAKVQLKAGTIIAAEKHPKADKLLKLQVDLGEEAPRQIIAGIALAYSPDELIGRQVVVVANLQPAKLRGEISQGMLLAADMGENGMALLKPDKEVVNGNKVR